MTAADIAGSRKDERNTIAGALTKPARTSAGCHRAKAGSVSGTPILSVETWIAHRVTLA